jgi:hypothetical protein
MKTPPENKAMHGGLGEREQPIERACDREAREARERKATEDKAVKPEENKGDE